MSALTGLVVLRDRISSRKRWCQGALAKNKYGLRVSPDSTDAVSWCLVGALQTVSLSAHVGEVLMSGLPKSYYGTLSHYNDTHTHAEVLQVVDRAIERLKKESAVV